LPLVLPRSGISESIIRICLSEITTLFLQLWMEVHPWSCLSCHLQCRVLQALPWLFVSCPAS
jgi:hypothetical protein